jgi:hypothetical protein
MKIKTNTIMKTIRNFFVSASVILFISLAFGDQSQAIVPGKPSPIQSGAYTISARMLSDSEIQSINTHSTQWIELQAEGTLSNSKFRLLDMNGKAVEKGSFKNGTCRMDVSGIPSGKYQIEVFTGEDWVYQSIVLL